MRFFEATHDGIANARANACRALSPDPVPAVLQNREAPDFQLPDASGKMVSLSAQRGHPVLVNFWATWCPPCVEEVPSMEDLARRLEKTDIRMLAVSVDDSWDAVRQFFVKGTKMGVLLDLSQERAQELRHREVSRELHDRRQRPRAPLLHQQARLVEARSDRLPREPAMTAGLPGARRARPARRSVAVRRGVRARARPRGIPPLPLLTLINFFNYLDRQVVYGMTPLIGETFKLSFAQLGLLATVNLLVFAVASLVSGPIADRIGPRKVIFAGILVWAIATIGSALSTSYPMLLFFRALVGVGEGGYGPSANTLLCADAPPEKRGRALGIYNVGMALGGTGGLALGALLAPKIGWRGVVLDRGRPVDAARARCRRSSRRRRACRARRSCRRAPICSRRPTSWRWRAASWRRSAPARLIFWARWLILEVRHFSVVVGSVFMAFVGLGVRRRRRGRRRLRGRHAQPPRARAGTRCAIGALDADRGPVRRRQPADRPITCCSWC